MSRMLSADDLVTLIEEKTLTKVYNLCGVGVGVHIDGTDFEELMIWVYERQNVDSLRVLTADIINVIEVVYSGYPQAQAAHFNRI